MWAARMHIPHSRASSWRTRPHSRHIRQTRPLTTPSIFSSAKKYFPVETSRRGEGDGHPVAVVVAMTREHSRTKWLAKLPDKLPCTLAVQTQVRFNQRAGFRVNGRVRGYPKMKLRCGLCHASDPFYREDVFHANVFKLYSTCTAVSLGHPSFSPGAQIPKFST